MYKSFSVFVHGFVIFTSALVGTAYGQATSGPFSFTVNNSTVSASGVVNEYFLPGFDGSLGELTAVEIKYEGVISNELGVEVFPQSYLPTETGFVATLDSIAGRGLFNLGVNSTNSDGFDSNQDPTAIWGDTTLFLLDGFDSSVIGALDAVAGQQIIPDGIVDFAGSSGASTGFQEVFRIQESVVLTNLFDLFRFEEETVSIFDFQAGAVALSGADSGSVARRVLSQGSGTVTVEYTYTAVPEPATVSLIVLCAMGGLVRRKRS